MAEKLIFAKVMMGFFLSFSLLNRFVETLTDGKYYNNLFFINNIVQASSNQIIISHKL